MDQYVVFRMDDAPLPSEEALQAAAARLEAEIEARLHFNAPLPPEEARAASSRATLFLPRQTGRTFGRLRAPKPKHFK